MRLLSVRLMSIVLAACFTASAHALTGTSLRVDVATKLRRKDQATARNFALLVQERGQNFMPKILASISSKARTETAVNLALRQWSVANPEPAADIYRFLVERVVRAEEVRQAGQGEGRQVRLANAFNGQTLISDDKGGPETGKDGSGKAFDGSGKKSGGVSPDSASNGNVNGNPPAEGGKSSDGTTVIGKQPEQVPQPKHDGLFDKVKSWWDDTHNSPGSNGGAGGAGGSGPGKITFADVIGVTEAKQQMMQFVDMFKNPDKYRNLGADVPRGILLVGPPGNGKTLLGRALANEAGFSCFLAKSGSEFFNKYVGESEATVRAVFDEARSRQPCIIFIDEIDSLAAARSGIDQSVAREYNAMVEALLVEMDGLNDASKSGKPAKVFVVGTTNRADLLDPAITRPGRLDRIIVVNYPDIKDREDLLKFYVKKKGVPTTGDVNFHLIAARTTGLSAAAIKNLVNEAALAAAADNATTVTMKHFLTAVDKIQMGGERRMVLSDEEKIITARHELGHALVASYTKGADPVGEITIIPRDIGALGVTTSDLPEDRKNWTRAQLENRISMAMGGRVAEKIFYNDYTTGASSDLENAENIAWRMVVEFGMSDKLGPVSYLKTAQGNYLSNNGKITGISEATQQLIDAEVKRILDEQEQKAIHILTVKKDILDKIVPTLVKKETLSGIDLRKMLKDIDTNPGDLPVQDPTGGAGGGNTFAESQVNVGCSAGRLR